MLADDEMTKTSTHSKDTFDLTDDIGVVQVPHPRHPDTLFECASPSSHDYDNLRRKHKIPGRVKRGRASSDDVDAGKFGEDLFCLIVKNWHNLTKNGKAYECNDANKRWLYTHARNLCDYITDEAERLNNESLGLELGN